MVVTEEPLSAKIGIDILKKGGNAIDAAVAVAFGLAVTHPSAGNLGGGGFLVYYDAKAKKSYALDFREKAPKAATKTMFLNSNGNVDNQKARFSAQSSGTPGSVKGLLVALEKFGTLSRDEVIDPAYKLAKKGFIVTEAFAKELKENHSKLIEHKATKQVYTRRNGSSYQAGDRLKQKDLAWSLKQIKRHGSDAFYKGKIAKKIVNYMRMNNGLISMSDLAHYDVKFRPPVIGEFKNYQIISMPPPSSGGIHLIQMLNILENFETTAPDSLQAIQNLAETMKVAYADRSVHLGDPDFSSIPIKELTSRSYAQQIAETIKKKGVRASSEIKALNLNLKKEGLETTHFSIIDTQGNAVALTTTLNFSYGNRRVVPGTGILLNNEMDDFSAKPGHPNGFGLVGGEKNAIEPEKRMLSSMTPSIVLEKETVRLVLGAPGGSRIITGVLQVLVNKLSHRMSLRDAVDAPRIHHQWLPDTLYYESLSDHNIIALKKRGYSLEKSEYFGRVQAIYVNPSDAIIYGKANRRAPKGAALGL